MDFADFVLDGIPTDELTAAQYGDFRLLAEKLRKNRRLNDLERFFIADRLEGKPQGKAKSGRKAKLQVLDIFVLDDFLALTEFYENNATTAQDLIARNIGCAVSKGKDEGKDNGNVRQRIKRAMTHLGNTHVLMKKLCYREWKAGRMEETFEYEGETFTRLEKPVLFCEVRDSEEIESLKRPCK